MTRAMEPLVRPVPAAIARNERLPCVSAFALTPDVEMRSLCARTRAPFPQWSVGQEGCSSSKLHRVLQAFSGESGGQLSRGTGEGQAGAVEATVNMLEAELQDAIEREDYPKAASIRDELRALQEDDRAQVLAANTKFYRTFEKGDLRQMRKVWANREHVHCIHPGAGCISGYELVMASWEVMLTGDAGFPFNIELQNVEVYAQGNVGIVTCVEVVRTQGSNWGRQVATNVFEKIAGKWLMSVHHASHFRS